MLGFMGSGKTTLGKKVASVLHYPFVDMDDLIEKKTGQSISSIFEQLGEKQFRTLEKEALQTVIQDYPTAVVATGGGAPCFYNNIAQMNHTGVSIYLRLSPEQLIRRIQGAQGHRPLLQSKNDKELLAFITEKLSEREPFYLQATYCVTHSNPQVQDILDQFN